MQANHDLKRHENVEKVDSRLRLRQILSVWRFLGLSLPSNTKLSVMSRSRTITNTYNHLKH
ncbi:hypothetical protein psageK4_053 [Pseudomonas phage psageK4]|uniref:Uncharacterized protein n=1 Tax=Pseudomonas phage psageK4 TaxID=2859563 RepID=A0ABX8SQT2_9CAUD|nr:hypothetical protein QGX14_gp053 [Pseudomonas phage psageK4]QXV71707.1 hypothetical protein psageK4_053 [Pseudomonas phage psageK4]